MISINPDIIERLPKGCHECPFAYYDEHNGAIFYCGLSRWSVNKQRKQKVRHRGCGLIDPDYNEEEQEKPKRDPVLREKTPLDVTNEIVSKAKKITSSLNSYDYLDEEDVISDESLEGVTYDDGANQEDDQEKTI